MNKLFYLFLLTVCGVTIAKPLKAPAPSRFSHASLLAQASELALSGPLTDLKLVSELETIHASAASEEDAVLAAYLLTLAPEGSLRKKAEFYMDFALSTPHVEQMLGRQAIVRLHRARGDLRYERGDFMKAAADFEALKLLASGFNLEYGKLMDGWCDMNQGHPEVAFAKWRDEVSWLKEKGVQQISPALLKSMGQAFAENTHRTREDTQALSALALSEDASQSFAQGITEGAAILRGKEAMEALVDNCEPLSFYPQLAKGIFEAGYGSGHAACDQLRWLDSDKIRPLTFELFGAAIASCVQWYASPSADKDRPNVAQRLKILVPSLVAKGAERNAKFIFWHTEGNSSAACLEGMEWLRETQQADDFESLPFESLPVELLTSHCVKGLEAGEEPAPEVLATFFRDVARSNELLGSEKSPHAYLLVRLMASALFRSEMVEEMVERPTLYSNTLVPTLALERSIREKDTKSVMRLLKALGKERVSAELNSQKPLSTWSKAYVDGVTEQITSGETELAMASLTDFFPFTPTTLPQGEPLRLWIAALLEAEPSAESKQKALELVTIETLKANPHLVPAAIDLALDLSLLPRVWELMSEEEIHAQYPEKQKPRLSSVLFNAMLDNAFLPSPTTSVSLQSLWTLADATRERSLAKFYDGSLSGPTIYTSDVKFLQQMGRDQKRSLEQFNKEKNPIKSLVTIVASLKRNVKTVNKQKWQHSTFSEIAHEGLADFCRQARASLHDEKYQGYSPDNLETWKTALLETEKRFLECETSALVPKEGAT